MGTHSSVLAVSLCLAGVLQNNIATGIMGLLFFGFVIVYILPSWFNTYYLIGEEALHIKSGLFTSLCISYNNITAIKETKSLLASTALSLDRLEIVFKNAKGIQVIHISPKDKSEFLSQLGIKRKD